MTTFIFGSDAFRDNERERAKTQEVLDALNGDVELEDFDTGELERIVEACKAEGTNEAARDFARKAQDHLDAEAERAYEQSLSNYYGGGSPQTAQERYEASWQEHREAHKR